MELMKLFIRSFDGAFLLQVGQKTTFLSVSANK